MGKLKTFFLENFRGALHDLLSCVSLYEILLSMELKYLHDERVKKLKSKRWQKCN